MATSITSFSPKIAASVRLLSEIDLDQSHAKMATTVVANVSQCESSETNKMKSLLKPSVLFILVAVIGGGCNRKPKPTPVATSSKTVDNLLKDTEAVAPVPEKKVDPQKPLLGVLNSLANSKADISDALAEHNGPIATVEEARALCELFKLLPRKKPSETPGSELVSLLKLAETATEKREPGLVVVVQANRELARIYDNTTGTEDLQAAEEKLFALRWLVMLRQPAGMHRLIAAARKGLLNDNTQWSLVFRQLDSTYPDIKRVFRELSDPLPPDGEIALGFIGCANRYVISQPENANLQHPFDSEKGIERLRTWLTRTIIRRYGDTFAYKVIEALPYLSKAAQNELLPLAEAHRNGEVRVGAAWATARTGKEQKGLEALMAFALDPNTSIEATNRLKGLGREDLIPKAAALEKEFAAKAKLASELHLEFNAPVDQMEIVDRREIRWPPGNEKKELWLIQFRIKDRPRMDPDVFEVGLVGEVPHYLLSQGTRRPPEDLYAMHLFTRLCMPPEQIEEEFSKEASEKEPLPKEWQKKPLKRVFFVGRAKMAPALKYPGESASLYSAVMEGERGWLLLDGPRSRWYPAADFPEDLNSKSLLEIHVGRVLLGFDKEPDRKKFLGNPPPPARNAEEIIKAFEFQLELAKSGSAEEREDIPDVTGPLYYYLDKFALALREKGKEEQLDAVLSFLEPHFKPYNAQGSLGYAAFLAGRWDEAEKHFDSVTPDESYHWHHGMYAEVKHSKGQLDKARQLLREGLVKLHEQSKVTSGLDRENTEKKYQAQLSALNRLFPSEAAELLKANNLPATTIPD